MGRAKVDAPTLKAAYKHIFSGPQGKIVREDLKDWCHILMPSFAPGDPYMTAYNEGARSVYLRICKMANVDLDRVMGAVAIGQPHNAVRRVAGQP